MPAVRLTARDDAVLIASPSLKTDRSARLFFNAVLGATPTPDGWRCPRRNLAIADLVVRINNFLEAKGWTVERDGIADEAVQREIERYRSFERTRTAAVSFRAGNLRVDSGRLRAALREVGWNEATRPLLDHQERGAIHGLTAINSANFSVPGSGKTITTLAIAMAHFVAKTLDVLLVVGPLSSFAPWEKEVRAALGRRFVVRRVRGTATERHVQYGLTRPGAIILISYASAWADRSALINLCKQLRVMLVVDESHRIKRFRGGAWAPALVEIAKHARMRVILSGTPMPQSGRDLYSQLNVLWPGGELTGPRDDFAQRVDKSFPAVLRDVQPFVSRTPKAALGLPDYQIVRHETALVGTQAEIYDLIESNFRRRIDGAAAWQDKLDALRRGRPIRLLQAAANPDLLNTADSYFRLPRLQSTSPTLMERLAAYRNTERPAKAEVALELLREARGRNAKTVCWSNFVPNLDFFSGLVREELAVPCFQIDGRIPAGDEEWSDDPNVQKVDSAMGETRERIIERFLGERGTAVLVTNPASCSESISLHMACHNAIYLDRTYDAALFLQSIDRIHRLGLSPDALVTIHIINATCEGRGTIDHLVDGSLQRKEQVMRQLLEGAELQPFKLSEDTLVDAEGDNDDLAELLRFLLGEDS